MRTLPTIGTSQRVKLGSRLTAADQTPNYGGRPIVLPVYLLRLRGIGPLASLSVKRRQPRNSVNSGTVTGLVLFAAVAIVFRPGNFLRGGRNMTMTWLLLATGCTGGLTLVFLARALYRRFATPPSLAVYFSPKGGCIEALVRELKSARREVLVQAYSFP